MGTLEDRRKNRTTHEGQRADDCACRADPWASVAKTERAETGAGRGRRERWTRRARGDLGEVIAVQGCGGGSETGRGTYESRADDRRKKETVWSDGDFSRASGALYNQWWLSTACGGFLEPAGLSTACGGFLAAVAAFCS